MTIYQQIPGGEVLSALVARINEQQDAIRTCERGSVEPTSKPIGLLWWCTNATILSGVTPTLHAGISEALLVWTGTAWKFLLDAEHAPLLRSGENSPIADIPFAGFKVTGLGDGASSGHSVHYGQVVLRSGANAWTGSQNAGGNRITNLAAPVDPGDAARKGDIPTGSGQTWFGGNRHLTHEVKYLDENAGLPSDYDTVCGFKPRHLRIRLEGRFRRQDNNSIEALAQTVVQVDRYDADSTGGFAGTPTTATVLVVAGYEVTVTWLATGFRLEFRLAGGGQALYLRNIVNAAVDGSIQVLALGDPSGG